MTLEQLIEQYRQRLEKAEKSKNDPKYSDIEFGIITIIENIKEFISDLEKLKPDFEFEGVAVKHSENQNTIFSPACILYVGIELDIDKHYQIAIKKLLQ